jgi:hypothetical protein
MRYILIAICVLFVSAQLIAQPEKEQKEALKKLSWMIGEWEGVSEIYNVDGSKSVVNMREKAAYNLDSSIIVVNGKGYVKDSVSNTNKMGHDAMAVVSYNAKEKKYRWNAWRNPGGIYTDLEIMAGDRSFEWGMEVPGGKTRFKAHLNEKGQWVETGEFSRNGKDWINFMSMTLDKVK